TCVCTSEEAIDKALGGVRCDWGFYGRPRVIGIERACRCDNRRLGGSRIRSRFMSEKSIGQDSRLERALSLEIVRVTERAAVAAARLRGRGAEKKSDQAPSMPC